MNRLSRDDAMMATAVIFSGRSTCGRLKVGAVLALDGRPLVNGYAGAPSGLPHCGPDVCNLNQPCRRTVHAEANAIAFAARKGIPIEGATLYTTHSPCYDCAKLIVNAGIVRVVYRELYRASSEAFALFDQVKIKYEESEIDLFDPESIHAPQS